MIHKRKFFDCLHCVVLKNHMFYHAFQKNVSVENYLSQFYKIRFQVCEEKTLINLKNIFKLMKHHNLLIYIQLFHIIVIISQTSKSKNIFENVNI
jgi:hypothetical protein